MIRIDAVDEDALGFEPERSGARQHVERRLGHVGVRMLGLLVGVAELALDGRNVDHVAIDEARAALDDTIADAERPKWIIIW